VEFALIAPVLFLVLFGVIEFGMSLNDYQSIRQGVRDGARQAVVQQYGSATDSCTSMTAPSDVKKVACLTEDRIGLGTDVRLRVRYTSSTGSGGDHGSVKVCAQRNVQPFTGAIPAIDGIILKSSIEMRMEKPIAEAIRTHASYPTFSESAPTGGSWSWC